MIFKAPSWAPTVSLDSIPDSIPACDFILDGKYGRAGVGSSKTPFVWGTTGQGYRATELRQRVEYLARALAHELDWHPNRGTEWDKTACVFSVNTVYTTCLPTPNASQTRGIC